jgi:hypothetical protein
VGCFAILMLSSYGSGAGELRRKGPPTDPIQPRDDACDSELHQ